MPESPQPPPNRPSPSDQQKLMEDILKGRISVAQLAEIERQRRIQTQAVRGVTARPISPPIQSSTRIATSQIRPDPVSRPTQPARQSSLSRTAAERRLQFTPNLINRPSSGSRATAPQTNPVRRSVQSNRDRPSPGAKELPAAGHAKSATKKASVSATSDSGKAPADKPGVASVPISQQIQRILSSHRGSTTAWILSEVLGPPVALRRENERNF
ncbi:MAG: hypothetical protein ACP5O1_00100 [Phycisphaerae bacterium]